MSVSGSEEANQSYHLGLGGSRAYPSVRRTSPSPSAVMDSVIKT
jgi:hypothetical protein